MIISELPLLTQQKLLAELKKYITNERWQLFQQVIALRTRHFAFALEDVFQDHNSGALIRSCDCFGIQDLYLVENRYSNKITHSIAIGSEKWVTLKRFGDSEDSSLACIEALKKENYNIIATSPHAKSLNLYDLPLDQKAVFFLGSEKKGLSESVLSRADYTLSIPIYGFAESYNVSVAGALIMQHLRYRLHSSNVAWQLREEEKIEILLDWTIKSIRSGIHLASKHLEDLGL